MTYHSDYKNIATEYPNYYAGRYLLEEDFKLQHKYHSTHQSLHNKSLYVSGIIEGLEVEINKENQLFKIKPGLALDKKGNLIVFKTEEEKLFSSLELNSPGFLYIINQIEGDQRTDEETRNIKENGVIKYGEEETVINEGGVKIASIAINEDETITCENKAKEYSGILFPPVEGEAITLRPEINTETNKPTALLSGNLSIGGELKVSQKSFLKEVEIKGALSVTEKSSLKEVEIEGKVMISNQSDTKNYGTIQTIVLKSANKRLEIGYQAGPLRYIGKTHEWFNSLNSEMIMKLDTTPKNGPLIVQALKIDPEELQAGAELKELSSDPKLLLSLSGNAEIKGDLKVEGRNTATISTYHYEYEITYSYEKYDVARDKLEEERNIDIKHAPEESLAFMRGIRANSEDFQYDASLRPLEDIWRLTTHLRGGNFYSGDSGRKKSQINVYITVVTGIRMEETSEQKIDLTT